MFDLGRVLAWCHGTGTATTTTYTIAKGNNITSVTRTSETSGAYTVTLQNMPHANYAAFVSAVLSTVIPAFIPAFLLFFAKAT